jgi:hypothetical protein
LAGGNNQVLGEVITQLVVVKEVVCQLRPAGYVETVKTITGRVGRMCKGPEAGAKLDYLRNTK